MFTDFLPNFFDAIGTALRYVFALAPIWLPIVFIMSAFKAWLVYRRRQSWLKQATILLEVKLPKDIVKSPLAMEVVLNAFHQPGGEGTWVDRIWKGQTRPWFSLEIVSLGGQIHFYIWTQARFRNLIESQIYSQYQGIEVYEVPDYTVDAYYDPDRNNVWGCEMKLTQPDPYPIKTYIDYGLSVDKNPKEEYKIDPMTPLLEFLGSLTAGHNAWIQILIRAHKKRRVADVFGEQEDSWKDQATTEVKKIMENFRPTDKEKPGRPPTEGEKEKIYALERSITKLPFDCGIRCVYMADKDKFNSANQGGVAGGFKQYGSLNLNGFAPTGWFGIFDYPWQDYFGTKKEWMKKKILDEYKLRQFFYSPLRSKKYYSKPFVLNTEELATIYHFPGQAATTPTMARVPSRKAEAPSNLPI